MVSPTTIRLPAQNQKLGEAAVNMFPIIKVVKHVKNDIRLPALSFNHPKKYTPTGPPTFKAANPKVGYMASSQTRLN